MDKKTRTVIILIINIPNTYINSDWKFFVIFTLAAECSQLDGKFTSIQRRHDRNH